MSTVKLGRLSEGWMEEMQYSFAISSTLISLSVQRFGGTPLRISA
jgi:hypothetical protein